MIPPHEGRSLRFKKAFIYVCLAGSFLASPSVYAKSKPSIESLARDFYSKLSPFYTSDTTIDTPEILEEPKAEVTLPPGTDLIFVAQVGERKLNLVGDIFGVFKEDGIYLSFYDFLSSIEFPIEYDVPNGIAKGWFIREEKTFDLNLNDKTLRIQGENVSLNEDTYYIDGPDLFVREDILEEWFGLTIKTETSRQNLVIKGDQPLPIEERFARRTRKTGSFNRGLEAQNPRLDTPYEVAEIPTVDVRATTFIFRPDEDSGTNVDNIYNVSATGDLGYFTADAFANVDDVEGLRSARLKFFRHSDQNDLLGPLKASKFEFGDISPVRSNFLGTAGLEQGVFVSNAKTRNSFNEQVADIEGDLLPDWDVELYDEDDRLLRTLTVEGDSRYFFEDVPLFPGNNEFRLVFYGPQGEIREEKVDIPLNINNLQVGSGIYEFSASRNNVTTFTPLEQERVIDDSLHLAGRVEYPVSENATLTFGSRYREEFAGEGTSITEEADEALRFAGTLSTTLGQTFVSTSVGTEALSGGYGAEIRASRRFNNLNGFAEIEYTSDDYSEASLIEREAQFRTAANLQGNVKNIFDKDISQYNLGFSTNASYTTSDSQDLLRLDQGLSWRALDVLFNSSVSYDRRDGEGVTSGNEEDLNVTQNLNYNFGKVRARGGVAYNVRPESELSTANAILDYRATPDLSFEAEVARFFTQDRTEYGISANYTMDELVFTPSFFTDTDGEIRGLITTRFSAAYNPYSQNITLSNRNLTRTGSLAAFVFVDMDEDGTYTEGDFPAPNVTIETLQSRRQATTDEEGIALVTGINTIATDIRLDRSSFEDPFWIPANEDISILPRPGHTVDMHIPLVIGGEVDGTVSTTNANGINVPVSNIRLNLIDITGNIVQTTRTASDGFYLFAQIYPGVYNVVPDPRDLRLKGLVIEDIPLVKLRGENNIAFGEDIYLDSENPIPFDYVNDLSRYVSIDESIDLSYLNNHSFILNFGKFRSQLLKALTWFRIGNLHHDILGDGYAIIPPSKSIGYLEDGETFYELRVTYDKPLTLEQSKQICRDFKERNIECKVEILPKGLRPTVPTVKSSLEARAG